MKHDRITISRRQRSSYLSQPPQQGATDGQGSAIDLLTGGIENPHERVYHRELFKQLIEEGFISPSENVLMLHRRPERLISRYFFSASPEQPYNTLALIQLAERFALAASLGADCVISLDHHLVQRSASLKNSKTIVTIRENHPAYQEFKESCAETQLRFLEHADSERYVIEKELRFLEPQNSHVAVIRALRSWLEALEQGETVLLDLSRLESAVLSPVVFARELLAGAQTWLNSGGAAAGVQTTVKHLLIPISRVFSEPRSKHEFRLSIRHRDVRRLLAIGERRRDPFGISINLESKADLDLDALDDVIDRIWQAGSPGLSFKRPLEQPLSAFVHSSINVDKHVKDGKFDLEHLGQSTRLALRLLSESLRHYPRPVPGQIRYGLSLGLDGFAKALIRSGLSYGQPESLKLLSELSATITRHANEELERLPAADRPALSINLKTPAGLDSLHGAERPLSSRKQQQLSLTELNPLLREILADHKPPREFRETDDSWDFEALSRSLSEHPGGLAALFEAGRLPQSDPRLHAFCVEDLSPSQQLSLMSSFYATQTGNPFDSNPFKTIRLRNDSSMHGIFNLVSTAIEQGSGFISLRRDPRPAKADTSTPKAASSSVSEEEDSNKEVNLTRSYRLKGHELLVTTSRWTRTRNCGVCGCATAGQTANCRRPLR